MTRVFVGITFTLAALLASLFGVRVFPNDEQHPPHRARLTAAYTQDYPDALTAAGLVIEQYLRGEHERIEREAAEEAARLEAARRVAVQPVARPGNRAPHTDAWWHAIAICEQGGRNDEFFGYFSIMDGSAGGLDWATQVGMANEIIARAGDGAWAASCVAMAYAAAPGG